MEIKIKDNLELKIGQTYIELDGVRNNKELKYTELFNSHDVIMGVLLDKVVEITFHNGILTYIKINGIQDFNRIPYTDIVDDMDSIKMEADRILCEDTRIVSVDTIKGKIVLSNEQGYNATLMAFDKNNILIKTINNTKDEY